MTDYVNQTRGPGKPLPVVANPPTDSRRWLFLKIDHLQFQDGLTFSEPIAPNFDVLNVLNDTAEEELTTDNLFSPNFRRPNSFTDPRRAMVGSG